MYPNLDETIKKALDDAKADSTLNVGILTPYAIVFPGQNSKTPQPRRVMIYNYDNDLSTPGYDSDERKVYYILEVSIKKVKYLEAMKLLRDVTTAIVKVLRQSPVMEGYSEYMDVEKITPEYSNDLTLKKAHIQLAFQVEENYGIKEEEFDTIDVNVEVE
jgi:hypothetical protein